MMKRCFSEADILELLSVGLSKEDERSLNEHLKTCDECCALLEQHTTAPEHVQKALAHASGVGGNTNAALDETLLPLKDFSTEERLSAVRALMEQDLAERQRSVGSRYHLLSKLGQGGLGSVWLARDENLRRFVAVKEVNHSVRESAEAMRRFRREAEVTGRLEHPSIVPVYQYGDDAEGGSSFYAMRYLGKKTLKDAIAEYHERREGGDHDPMLLHHLLTTFVAICQAIAYANSRYVVHRDLKPENVALDDYGQVIVLDWGLAKLIGDAELDEAFEMDAASHQSSLTQTMAGQVLGTPMYMAPEQAAGRTDDVDVRTDVYGLGAILFSILTGKAPHEESQASLSANGKTHELFETIATQPPPLARSLVADVPPELDAICAKAMARKQYARFASASELAEDVQRVMVGESVTAYPEPWRKRCVRWIARHRRLSQIAGVLLTILIVAGVTIGVNSRQNYLTAKRKRYDQMNAEAVALRSRLHLHAKNLTQQTRFMASLPPIQGVIDARAAEKVATGPAIGKTDSEEVWRERLQTIYRGLLNAHPGYLSVEYDSTGESTKEIVRVERNSSADSLVRVVPKSRLAELDPAGGPLASMIKLSPGDVHLSTTSLNSVGTERTPGQRLILTAGIPVYDENSGDVFGVVAIRSDLESTLRELIAKTVTATDTVYVVDHEGKILLHHTRTGGFRPGSQGEDVVNRVPSLERFFTSEKQTDVFTDNERVVAIKTNLDPRLSGAVIGLVFVAE